MCSAPPRYSSCIECVWERSAPTVNLEPFTIVAIVTRNCLQSPVFQCGCCGQLPISTGGHLSFPSRAKSGESEKKNACGEVGDRHRARKSPLFSCDCMACGCCSTS